MMSIFKALCIGTYLLGAAGALGLLPPSLDVVPWLAAGLLGAHVLEIPIAYRHLKNYPGPLATSIVLTILFGFLHWLPLRKQAAQ